MPLPQRLVDFIHGRTVSYLGTRNAALSPRLDICLGVRVGRDNEHLIVYVIDRRMDGLLQNLREEGEMAVSVGEDNGHECYQFKGRCVGVRPSTEADYAVQDLWWDKILGPWETQLSPEDFKKVSAQLCRRPTFAVELQIREIFDQTPGPGSGRKLDPSAGGV